MPSRYLLPALLLIDVAFLFNRGGQWQGQWLWTVDWAAGGLIIIGPIAAALASWHVQFQQELASGPFPFGRSVLGVFRSQYAWIGGLHGCVVLLALVMTYLVNPRPGLAILHGLPQFAILAGYIALGIIAGTLIRSWFTGPLLAIGLFLVPAFHTDLVPRALTRFGGATGNPAGTQANWTFDVRHSLFGLGVLLLLGVLAVRRPWRRSVVAMSLVSAGLGFGLVVTSLSFFAHTHAERFVLRREPLICSRDAYTLCLTQDSIGGAGRLSNDMRAVLDDEHHVGAASVPTGLVQVTDSQSRPVELTATTHPISAQPDTFSGDRGVRLQVVLPYLLLDTRCADRSQPTAEQFQSLQILQDYFLDTIGHLDSARSDPAYGRLARLSTAARTRWLAHTLTATNTCKISDIALPTS